MHMNDNNNHPRLLTHIWRRENGISARNTALCEESCRGIAKFASISAVSVMLGTIPISCMGLPSLHISTFLQMIAGGTVGGVYTSCMIASLYISQMDLNSEPAVNRYLRNAFFEFQRVTFDQQIESQTPFEPSSEWIPVCGMQAVAGTSLVTILAGTTSYTPALCAGIASSGAMCCIIFGFKGMIYCLRSRNNAANADIIVTNLPQEIQTMQSQNIVGEVPYIPLPMFIREVALQNPEAARQLEQFYNIQSHSPNARVMA